MKKFFVFLLLVSIGISLIACTETPSSEVPDKNGAPTSEEPENNGTPPIDADENIITAVDGKGQTLVIGETDFDLYYTDYTVGTPTLTYEQVKAKFQTLETNSVVMSESLGTDVIFYVWNKDFYYYNMTSLEEAYAHYYYKLISANDYMYLKVSNPNDGIRSDWQKQYEPGNKPVYEVYDKLIEMEAKAKEIYFDDNSIIIISEDYDHYDNLCEYVFKIKIITNYEWEYPEAELVEALV